MKHFFNEMDSFCKELYISYTVGSDGCFLPSDTISRSIKMSMSENADSSFWKVSWFIRNVQEETWVIKQNYIYIYLVPPFS